MNYLITGATGLLGNNVLRMLLTEENSATVTVGAGDPRPLDGLNVEKSGDRPRERCPQLGKEISDCSGRNRYRDPLRGFDSARLVTTGRVNGGQPRRCDTVRHSI